MTDQAAIYVDGVGHIGQYNSYIDCLWEKGVVYFIRDYFFTEIQERLERGDKAKDVRPLISRLHKLNSDIAVYEQQWQHRR